MPHRSCRFRFNFLRSVVLIMLTYLGTAAAVEPDTVPPDKSLIAALKNAASIEEGSSERVIYTLFDANCPACQLLYSNLRRFVRDGDITIRWVPVAIVNETSLGKAAAMLDADDPLAAFRRNEENYDSQSYSGAIEEQIPAPETELRLRRNTQLMSLLRVPVVPTMVFIDRDGETTIMQGALSPLALSKVIARVQ